MQLLPIGSVVKLKNSDQPLMITTRFPIANFNGKEGYFEYDSCLYPQGAYHNQHFFLIMKILLKFVFGVTKP